MLSSLQVSRAGCPTSDGQKELDAPFIHLAPRQTTLDLGLGPSQRTAVEINESDILPAPCGKLTRLGGIPGSSLGRYAGRHGRQAGDSAKVGSGRLEAR